VASLRLHSHPFLQVLWSAEGHVHVCVLQLRFLDVEDMDLKHLLLDTGN